MDEWIDDLSDGQTDRQNSYLYMNRCIYVGTIPQLCVMLHPNDFGTCCLPTLSGYLD